MKLKNKVALITGASRGIGKTTALLFAQEGAKVIINYKSSKEKAEALAKKIGKMALAVQADVSQEKDVERLIKEAVDMKKLTFSSIMRVRSFDREIGEETKRLGRKLWTSI